MAANMIIEGLSDLMQEFEGMEAKASNALMDKAIDAGAQKLIPAIRRRAPRSRIHRTANKTNRGRMVKGRRVVRSSEWRSPMRMADSIGASRKNGKNGRRYCYVGPDNGAAVKENSTPHFYWFFHEFGTTKLRAKPFMGPAYEESAQAIEKAMIDTALEGIGIE